MSFLCVNGDGRQLDRAWGQKHCGLCLRKLCCLVALPFTGQVLGIWWNFGDWRVVCEPVPLCLRLKWHRPPRVGRVGPSR